MKRRRRKNFRAQAVKRELEGQQDTPDGRRETAGTRTLKPGLLVALHTRVTGGVQYTRVDLDEDREGATETSKWETTRVVEDAEEHEAAIQIRGKARSLIVRQCAPTIFGLLCPQTNERALDAAIEEAGRLCAAFNEGARTCRAAVYAIKGRIAKNDRMAVREISRELADLMDRMKAAVKAAEPEEIRAACKEAQDLGRMLDTEQEERVSAAVKAARSAARTIVKRVVKAGEKARDVVKELKTKPISSARFAFLDLVERSTDEAEEPAARVQTAPIADLDTED